MSEVDIEGLTIHFPYVHIHPEQVEFMKTLKALVESKGKAIVEMPPGTGKTVALLSFMLSYNMQHRITKRIIYCCKSVKAISQVINELKRCKQRDSIDILALGITSRNNLCLNPTISTLESRVEVDAGCWKVTNPWVQFSDKLCPYYSKLHENDSFTVPKGIYCLKDVIDMCELGGICPYFMTRKLIKDADIIVCTHRHFLDVKNWDSLGGTLPSDSLVVFDEATTIDNTCLDILSINFRRKTISDALANIRKLKEKVIEAKQKDEEILNGEYYRLLLPINECGLNDVSQEVMLRPYICAGILEEAVPGNIRKVDHFLNLLKRILVNLRQQLKLKEARIQSHVGYLYNLRKDVLVDAYVLKFLPFRFKVLMHTLEIEDLSDYLPLSSVCEFCAILSNYDKEFAVVLEPYPEKPEDFDPVIQLACLDANVVMKNVIDKFDTVLFMGSSMSPISIYPKLLNFTPSISTSIPFSNSSSIVCPLILTKGSDQLAVSSKIDERDDEGIMRNYGDLLLELADNVPDGIVCFFPSFKYMESVIHKWNETGLLFRLLESKLLFFESRDSVKTERTVKNFKLSCDVGRGGIFLASSRGYVADCEQFSGHYARCMTLFGVPFQNTLSRVLKARLSYLKEYYSIDETEFLNFEAIRQAVLCAGSTIRSKHDYVVHIFADKRYSRNEKIDKLPEWVSKSMRSEYMDLSTDVLMHIAGRFLKDASRN
jgi:DNA excision repair protein ERCC-2